MITVYNELSQPWNISKHSRRQLVRLRKEFNKLNQHYSSTRREKSTVGISGYVNSFSDIATLNRELKTLVNMDTPKKAGYDLTSIAFNHKEFAPVIRPLTGRPEDLPTPLFCCALEMKKRRLVNVECNGSRLLTYFIDAREFSFVAGTVKNCRDNIRVTFYDPKTHLLNHYTFTISNKTGEASLIITDEAATDEHINMTFRPVLFKPSKPTNLIFAGVTSSESIYGLPTGNSIKRKHRVVTFEDDSFDDFKQTVNEISKENYRAVTLYTDNTKKNTIKISTALSSTAQYLCKRFNFVNVLYGDGEVERFK